MARVRYKKTEVYDLLTEKHDIFENYIDVIIFMAILGYREDNIKTQDYLGDQDERSEIGIELFHNHNHYHAIVAALAFQKTGDPSSMADPEVHREVIPQYAAGGLEVFQEEFGEVAGDPTDALANYIKSCTVDETSVQDSDELQTIIQSFDDEMFNT